MVDKFKTKCRIKDGYAMLDYEDGESCTLPVYAEPSGAVSCRVEREGEFSLSLLLPRTGIVESVSWGGSSRMRLSKGDFVHVTIQQR